MKVKSFIKDSLINIISAAVPLLILQLFSLPIVANFSGGDQYGVVILLISIITVISLPLGNTLNNIKLLMYSKYKHYNVEGDYNPLLSGFTLFGIVLIVVYMNYASLEFVPVDYLFLITLTVLFIWKEYLIVTFRLELNYRKILISNLLLSLGYIIGTFIFYIFGYWQFIYLVGLFFSLIYIIFNTRLYKEKYKITLLFKENFFKTITLYISVLLKNIINYLDKIILFPLLGPLSVSIYYTATIIGNIVSLMINPINSVILSYLIKKESININVFLKAFSGVVFLGFISYFITIYISPYFFNAFYTDWAEESLRLIYITTGTATVKIISTMIHPFNLRFNNIRWQIYTNIIYILVYVTAVYFLYNKYELVGFALGVLISAVFNLLLQLGIFLGIYYKNGHEIKSSI